MSTKVIVTSEHGGQEVIHEDGCCIELSECSQHLIVMNADKKTIGIYPSGFFAIVVPSPDVSIKEPSDDIRDAIDRLKKPSTFCPGFTYDPYPQTLPLQDPTGPGPFPNQPMCSIRGPQLLCEEEKCCQRFPCELNPVRDYK